MGSASVLGFGSTKSFNYRLVSKLVIFRDTSNIGAPPLEDRKKLKFQNTEFFCRLIYVKMFKKRQLLYQQ